MALISLGTSLPWPGLIEAPTGGISLGSAITMTAAGHYIAYIISAKEAMVVSHVGFRNSTATGSPTVDVRIETVDATTGQPTGTLWSPTTNLVSGTLTTNTWNLLALTSSATISKGQVFAIVLRYNSGTSIIINSFGGAFLGGKNFPYQITNTGTPTKATMTMVPIALGSSSTVFYNVRGLWPVSAVATNTFNNTNSARRGLRFKLPFPARATAIRFGDSTSTGDFRVTIYDDAGTELSSSHNDFDGDVLANLNGVTYAQLANTVDLAADTWYRAVVEPQSATNITLFTLTLPSLNYIKAIAGTANAHYTTYASGAWTDTATDQLPILDVLLDAFADDTGTGSGGSTARVIGG